MAARIITPAMTTTTVLRFSLTNVLILSIIYPFIIFSDNRFARAGVWLAHLELSISDAARPKSFLLIAAIIFLNLETPV